MIKTKLYGICKVLKELSTNYYELKALEDSFFYKSGEKFRIYLVDIKPQKAIQLSLFDL